MEGWQRYPRAGQAHLVSPAPYPADDFRTGSRADQHPGSRHFIGSAYRAYVSARMVALEQFQELAEQIGTRPVNIEQSPDV